MGWLGHCDIKVTPNALYGPEQWIKKYLPNKYYMATSDFEKAIDIVLKHEGGFVNNPNDPGGATKYGISIKFLVNELQNVIGDDGFSIGDINHDHVIDADDIKNMTIESAKKIYKACWWDKFHYELISNQDVATKILDCAVNMGNGTAHKLAQLASNDLGANPQLATDGQLGSKSIFVINSFDPQTWLKAMCIRQKKYYDNIIDRNSKLEVFRKGWYNRSMWPFTTFPWPA